MDWKLQKKPKKTLLRLSWRCRHNPIVRISLELPDRPHLLRLQILTGDFATACAKAGTLETAKVEKIWTSKLEKSVASNLGRDVVPIDIECSVAMLAEGYLSIAVTPFTQLRASQLIVSITARC